MAIQIEKDGIKITVDTGDELRDAVKILKESSSSDDQSTSRRGRPPIDKSAIDERKSDKFKLMAKKALQFLEVIHSSTAHWATSESVQLALKITEPRALGSYATITNRCLERIKIEPKSVYRKTIKDDSRGWQGQSKLTEAISALKKQME